MMVFGCVCGGGTGLGFREREGGGLGVSRGKVVWVLDDGIAYFDERIVSCSSMASFIIERCCVDLRDGLHIVSAIGRTPNLLKSLDQLLILALAPISGIYNSPNMTSFSSINTLSSMSSKSFAKVSRKNSWIAWRVASCKSSSLLRSLEEIWGLE